ncbi:putative nucleic acid-binding protein [Opitutaceae bacterium TAV1]|nr:putative nucleic acid-binding protein [Opitutaceae bacterium TAV1]
MKRSAPVSLPNIIVDAGPLAALLNRRDPAHNWAGSYFLGTPGHYVVTYSAITEACHHLDNRAVAIAALRQLIAKWEIVAPDASSALEEMERWAPGMDFTDACVVLLVRKYARAFALTTDHRDFSTYRIPFASPKGDFY